MTASPSASHGARAGAAVPAVLLNGVVALLLLGVALWLWFGAAAIADSHGLVGPSGFPRAVGVLLGGASIAVLVRSVLARRSAPAVHFGRPPQLVLAIGLVVAYPLLISFTGYYIATALWLPPLLRVSGLRGPVAIVAVTAGFLLFTRVLFQMVLGTPLP